VALPPAYQVQGPEFKLQYHLKQTKKKKKKEKNCPRKYKENPNNERNLLKIYP
jgi:hypothetical protein